MSQSSPTRRKSAVPRGESYQSSESGDSRRGIRRTMLGLDTAIARKPPEVQKLHSSFSVMTPLTGISLTDDGRRHSQPASLLASSFHSKAMTGFDVDTPRTPMVRHPDDSTLVSNDHDEGLTEEQRAWAGIESVLDDNETIDTSEVLPEEVIKAMSYSYSSLQSASLRMGSPRKNRATLSRLQESKQSFQEEEEEHDDGVSLDSHDRAMKKLCGGHNHDGDNESIPALLNSSFSSLQSEQTTKSILSFVSAKNLIVQDDVDDGPLKDFLGDMTKALERKKHVGPVEEDGNNIFNIFSWSQKENVDHKEKTGHKRKDFLMPENRVLTAEQSIQGHDSFNEQDLLLTPQTAFFQAQRDFNPNDELNNSMPSLTSIRESDIANSQHVKAQKWASFGDLEFDPAQPVEPEVPAADEVIPKKRKKKKHKKKKPGPEQTKKKKKKKKAEPIKCPEQTFDNYFPAFEPQESILASPVRSAPPTPRVSNRSKSYLLSPNKSRSMRFRDHKNPLSALRSRMPKISLFGKGRQQQSPTAVIDTGAREAQFFPGIDEEEGEWGGLLSN